MMPRTSGCSSQKNGSGSIHSKSWTSQPFTILRLQFIEVTGKLTHPCVLVVNFSSIIIFSTQGVGLPTVLKTLQSCGSTEPLSEAAAAAVHFTNVSLHCNETAVCASLRELCCFGLPLSVHTSESWDLCLASLLVLVSLVHPVRWLFENCQQHSHIWTHSNNVQCNTNMKNKFNKQIYRFIAKRKLLQIKYFL